MKYTTGMLKKHLVSSLLIDEILDFSKEAEIAGDIARIEQTSVKGEGYYYLDNEEYVFNLEVKTKLYMICAITLVEIPIKIEFNREYIFKDKIEDGDDDVYLVDGFTINLDQVIWSDILIEKPMKVTAQDAKASDIGATTEDDLSEEVKPNRHFADLKDFFKDK